VSYTWPLVCLGAVLSVALFAWFQRLPYAVTPEEELKKALRHQSAEAAVS
jgi:hypothetical protein